MNPICHDFEAVQLISVREREYRTKHNFKTKKCYLTNTKTLIKITFK